MTDFRDLEGYTYNPRGCEHFAFVFNRQQLTFADLNAGLEESLLYLSSVRLTAPVDGENLKINKALGNLKKYDYDISNGSIKINKDIFLKKLLQNSGVSLKELNRISNRVETLSELFNLDNSIDHVHGKDLIKLLSIYFNCDPQEMQRHLWGALNYCIEDIRQLPAITKTLSFLTP